MEKMVAEHPDYLVGVSQYVSNGQGPDEVLARSRALGPNREITNFTPGKGGRYHLQEFLLHETAVITVLTVERNYEESIYRLQRLLDLELPPLTHYQLAQRIALLHLANGAEAMENDLDNKETFDLPTEVAGAEEAVELVRTVFAQIMSNLSEGQLGSLN